VGGWGCVSWCWVFFWGVLGGDLGGCFGVPPRVRSFVMPSVRVIVMFVGGDECTEVDVRFESGMQVACPSEVHGVSELYAGELRVLRERAVKHSEGEDLGVGFDGNLVKLVGVEGYVWLGGLFTPVAWWVVLDGDRLVVRVGGVVNGGCDGSCNAFFGWWWGS
jgi:hypothetical protein